MYFILEQQIDCPPRQECCNLFTVVQLRRYIAGSLRFSLFSVAHGRIGSSLQALCLYPTSDAPTSDSLQRVAGRAPLGEAAVARRITTLGTYLTLGSLTRGCDTITSLLPSVAKQLVFQLLATNPNLWPTKVLSQYISNQESTISAGNCQW